MPFLHNGKFVVGAEVPLSDGIGHRLVAPTNHVQLHCLRDCSQRRRRVEEDPVMPDSGVLPLVERLRATTCSSV